VKSYRVAYRLAPSAYEVRDLFVAAPDARAATEKAKSVLKLRYPHFAISGVYPSLTFDSDAEEMYPHAGARR